LIFDIFRCRADTIRLRRLPIFRHAFADYFDIFSASCGACGYDIRQIAAML